MFINDVGDMVRRRPLFCLGGAIFAEIKMIWAVQQNQCHFLNTLVAY